MYVNPLKCLTTIFREYPKAEESKLVGTQKSFICPVLSQNKKGIVTHMNGVEVSLFRIY